MAVIPQIVTSPGMVPSTGGSQVRVSPQVDVRAPADPSQAQGAAASMESQALQTTARAGERLADYGAQFAEQYVKAKLNVDAANHQAELSKQLHEAEFESSKIADRQAATVDFDARSAKIRDQFAATDVNPTVRAAVDASLPNQIALRRASTQNAAFGLESKAQVGQLINNIDQYNKQAVDAQDPRLTEQLIAQANAAIDGRVQGGWLGADVAAKMKVDFGSNVYMTKMEIAFQKDMRTGLAIYEATKGKLNAADGRRMAVMAADRTKQVAAEASVSTNMPTLGGGTGGDVGSVRADAEKTLGFPLTITSADRTDARNKEVGGAPGSQHLGHGKALDISLAGLTDEQKTKVYNQFLSDPRVGGIGFYAGHLHVDTRGGPRTTWGTPPPGVADQVKTWQSSAPAAPSGDQHSQSRIAQFQYRQSVVNDLSLDPEIKARQLSIIDQRMGNQNAIVLEQRKSAADAAEKAGIDLNTGKYKAGTFQGIADQFTATGDSSSAATMQVLADNEAALIEDAKNPPAQRSAASMLLPGAAGKIAAQKSAEARADLTEQRQLAAQSRTEYRRLGAEQEKLFSDGLNSDISPEALVNNARDAYQYYRAAGDLAKAESIKQQLDGALEGALKAKLPPAERERLKQEFQQRAANPEGLSVRDANIAKQLAKGEEANRQRWDFKTGDPLNAANDAQRLEGGLKAFNTNLAGAELQLWATERLKHATQTTLAVDPNATNVRSPFFTVAEMSDITQKLDGMRPQEAQQFLARLAAAVPAQAIALIGDQMSKKDVVSDSYAAALGLYKRGMPGDLEIANRVIVGMNWLAKGGPDGKTRVDVNAQLMTTITDALGAARVGMPPAVVAQQNNAIIANYVGLTANAPDRTAIKPTELTQAMDEIVGRPATINGGATLIPREIDRSQFQDGVAAITAADVANLQPTAQGQPITAEVVRQHGQFVPSGDGKYIVRIPDPLRSGRTMELIDSNTGRPWVVDIRPLIARGVRSSQEGIRPDRPIVGVSP